MKNDYSFPLEEQEIAIVTDGNIPEEDFHVYCNGKLKEKLSETPINERKKYYVAIPYEDDFVLVPYDAKEFSIADREDFREIYEDEDELKDLHPYEVLMMMLYRQDYALLTNHDQSHDTKIYTMSVYNTNLN